MNVILIMLGSWVLGLFIIFNKLTKGALVNIIKCKVNKKLKLVKIYSLNEVYFTTGKYIDNQIEIKQRHKDKHTRKRDTKKIAVPENIKLYRVFGIDTFELYEKNNELKLIEDGIFNTLSSYDSTLQDMLIERAIMRPSLKEEEIQKLKIIMIIAVIAGGLAFIASVYGVMMVLDTKILVEQVLANAIPLI